MTMMLTNAVIRTSDAARPVADTLVVDDGTISFVGRRGDAGARADVTVHDLGGRTVIPGIVDSHAHPTLVARSLWHVRLPWTTDVDEILDFIRDYAAQHPKEEAPYLYFEYYPSETFRDFPPTKELLDSAVSDRPVFCQDFSEHEHWVNSRMLELMGITKDTPDPVPGLEMFVRDEHGEPTGQLREFVHLNFTDRLYEALGWMPPEDITPERIAPFFRFMSEHGVTTLFEALVEDDTTLAAIAELDRRGEFPFVYEGALRFRDSRDLDETIARLKQYDGTYASAHLRMRTLKLFLDGTNELGNSALLAPQCRHGAAEDAYGEIAMPTTELVGCLLRLNDEQVDLHIHLVGDRGFRAACDAVEEAQRRLRDTGGVWRMQVTLAHCELIDPADFSRPAELGIIVNWSTHWSGGYFGEGSKKYLGDERFDRMYRFTEIEDAGGTLTFSSDVVTGYELHRGDPFFGMQVAATRVDPEYPLDESRYPKAVRPSASSRLGVETLLRGYTIDGARQLRLQDRVGSLEVGKSANLVVLNADPIRVPAEELAGVRPDAVLFEGRVVAGSL